MAGYWNCPDLDRLAFCFTEAPDGSTVRWYRTGDIVAERPDGEYVFYGRSDNQVQVRGHRVELETVESAVGDLPGIAQAVVGLRGSANASLVVRYIPDTTSSDATEQDPNLWRKTLAAQLPPYAMPSLFEQATSFPLTSSGKIDRRTVRNNIAQSTTQEPYD